MKNGSMDKLRIVLLTRTGRPSGEEILKKLVSAQKEIVGVVAEKRSRILLNHGVYKFFKQSIQQHGYAFLFSRAKEFLKALIRGDKDFLKTFCSRHHVPFFLVDDHNSESSKDILQALEADVLITANTRIIKSHILNTPARAAINFHTSKLPQYAGLDSIFWALYHGENEIGVTIHYLKEGLDTGHILSQETIPVTAHDDIGSLTAKANEIGSQLVAATIDKFESGDFSGVAQDLKCRSYFSWPTPEQRQELHHRMAQRTYGKPAC
jgi:folate-dependent phosphoribosylglycinamide formyltransferase PurN